MVQDRTIAERYLQDGIVLRELEPEISYVFGLSYAETLREPEQAFVQFIFENIRSNNFFHDSLMKQAG